MRDYWREINGFLARFLSPAVRVIILVNVLIFLFSMLLTPFSGAIGGFFALLVQTPQLAVERFCIWQFVTYMFMHADFFHLLFNMMVLWFFASRLEYKWGTWGFVRFYLVVGVGAGFFHTALAYLTGKPGTGMLGASGAVYGVMLAYALYWPNDTVWIMAAIPIKIKYLMIFVGVMAFFSSIQSAMMLDRGNISHVTHLGGLFVALLYLRWQAMFPRGGGGGGGWGGFRRKRKATILKVNPRNHPDFH